jgi:hypothetical protein
MIRVDSLEILEYILEFVEIVSFVDNSFQYLGVVIDSIKCGSIQTLLTCWIYCPLY